MLIYATLALCAGFILDLLLGDPQGWPHIARLMGALIERLQRPLYPLKNKRRGGTLLVICVLVLCTAVPAALLYLAFRVSPWLYFALETLLVWQLIAVKSLRTESGAVYRALTQKDLPAAKRALSMIVGRDTDPLDEAGVTRAAVETVAENTADGVAAPLFFIMLGGAPLGCLYKAANTMDSMLGYKNERYLDFGRCAAKLDDALNYLPARLCALVMIAAASLGKFDAGGAKRIWIRDRRCHASPNSAQTEAAAAGALGVRLGGDAYYAGVLHKKPYIGDELRPIETEDIRRCHRLLYAAAALTLAVTLIFRGLLYAAL